jgi:hypothetical protein
MAQIYDVNALLYPSCLISSFESSMRPYTGEVKRVVPNGIKSMPKEQQRRINLMHLQAKLALQSTSLISSTISIDSDDVDSLFDELHTCVAWLVHEVGPRCTSVLFTNRLLMEKSDTYRRCVSQLRILDRRSPSEPIYGTSLFDLIYISQLRVWCQEERLLSLFFIASCLSTCPHASLRCSLVPDS